MNQYLARITGIILLLSVIGLVLPSNAFAQNLTVTCSSSTTCDPDTSNPLFDTSILWYPTLVENRVIRIVNTSGADQQVSARVANTFTAGDLDTVMNVTITRLSTGLPVFTGTLRQFYESAALNFGVIPDAGDDEYTVTVELPDVGNEYQNRQTGFDLLMDFETEDATDSAGLLSITKTNNALNSTRQQGSAVIYTLKVTAGDSTLNDVEVIDLPPEGIRYRGGSWTASSNLRGNLKGTVVPEPRYSSPGTWKLGTVQPNEVITLSYRADIADGLDPGIYRDLAWAEGDAANGAPVTANITVNNPDPFVGTDVTVVRKPDTETYRVVQRERVRNEDGNVLGASTKKLPKTGVSDIQVVAGIALLLVGAALVFLRKLNLKGVKSVIIVAIFLAIPFLVPQAAFAANLSVRIEQPRSPTNENDFPLGYVVLDRVGRPIQVECQVKKPGQGFSTFALVNVRAGGNSGVCQVNSSVMGGAGLYQFQIIAKAGADIDISEIVTVDYLNVSGPGTPTAYTKDRAGACEYKVRFKTADDSGRTTRVEVYRSSSTTFTADSDTRIENIATTSNKEHSIQSNVSDCSKTYYFAVRAFDQFGNGSDVVGDQEIRVTVVGGTTTGGGTTTTGGGAVAVAGTGNQTNPTAQPTGTGDVQGATEDEEATDSPGEDDVLGAVTGSPLRMPLPSNTTFVIGIALLVFGVILVSYVYIAKKTSRKRR